MNMTDQIINLKAEIYDLRAASDVKQEHLVNLAEAIKKGLGITAQVDTVADLIFMIEHLTAPKEALNESTEVQGELDLDNVAVLPED
jgi:hypothetical protein